MNTKTILQAIASTVFFFLLACGAETLSNIVLTAI